MKSALLVLLFATALYSATAQRIARDTIPLGKGSLIIQPRMHASVLLTVSGKTIYVDPVGGAAKYQGLAAPDFILITHIHGDHFDSSTIAGIKPATTVLIVPKGVADKLPVTDNIVVLANGNQSKQAGMTITAVPMYNLP